LVLHERFTFTPEPPSVNLSALPRPLVPETSNENGSPFPRWTCKCNQSPFQTALQLLLAFWIWRSCPLVPTHRSELQWPNHSFTTGLKRLSGDRHKEPRERCAQFGVSAVFRYAFRSTKRSSSKKVIHLHDSLPVRLTLEHVRRCSFPCSWIYCFLAATCLSRDTFLIETTNSSLSLKQQPSEGFP
jgi:hypothetical protein